MHPKENPRTEIEFPPENFIHPDRGSLPVDNEIPLAGSGIRGLVDALRPDARFSPLNPQEGTARTLDEVSYVVRLRYPTTAAKVDEMYEGALGNLQENPGSNEAKSDAKRAIALAGAFNYARGIQVLRRDDPSLEIHHDEKGIPTDNVKRDTDIVPNFTLSPSALYQLQERAGIEPGDDVLYLCSGAGGGIFFAAAAMPSTLEAVDLFTPQFYDLEGTFALAKEEIFAKVPELLKPEITTPSFIQLDASKLPMFGTEDARESGLSKDHYNKILLHPPFGRESMLSKDLQTLTEADGFMLWVGAILSANAANGGEANLFSIIPPEWGRAIDSFRAGGSMEDVLRKMYDELRELPYYKGANASKLELPYDRDSLSALNSRRKEIEEIFGSDYSRQNLEEMGMFPLQINSIHLPGRKSA